MTTTTKEKKRSCSRRDSRCSGLGLQLAAPSLACSQSVLASAVASDSTSSILFVVGLAGLVILAEVPLANGLLTGHESLLVEVNAHQRRQPMRVEIRIGESTGEGEDLPDIGFVV